MTREWYDLPFVDPRDPKRSLFDVLPRSWRARTEEERARWEAEEAIRRAELGRRPAWRS